MKFLTRILILGFALFTASAQAATQSKYTMQTQPTPPSSTVSTRDADDDRWKFTIAPYLWALSLNGSVQVRSVRAPVSESFSDIFDDLNWGAMVWLEANKGKWGAFFNTIYASLSQGASDRYISAHANVNFTLLSAGLSYELYKTCLCSGGCQYGGSTFALVPYIGARYTSANTSLTVNTPIGGGRRSDNQHWTDPIVGARFNFDLTKAWLLTFSGDVGGTNMSSDYSYNVIGLVGYKPQTMMKFTTWYLGYRLLDQKYTHGTSSNYFMWDMKLQGPMAGVAFTF